MVVIRPDGVVVSLYNEDIDLGSVGKLKIRRASHVEPDEDGKWWADMSPVGGPKLGPFKDRSKALKAEVEWLERNWIR